MKNLNPKSKLRDQKKVINKKNKVAGMTFEGLKEFHFSREKKFRETGKNLREFTKKLKKRFSEEDQNKIYNALMLMYSVHIYQDRPDGNPEINHSISVANIVLKMLSNPDKDLIIAALLHDSVENQAKKLAYFSEQKVDARSDFQKESLALLKKRYGERVAKIVSHLSNPNFPLILEKLGIKKGDSVFFTEKHKLYAEHVRKSIEDIDVLIVKLADFADNALKLSSWKPKDEEEKTRRNNLISKYLPVVDIFINRLKREKLFPKYAEKITKEAEKLKKENGFS